ncbi:MAG: B12-binding domain-containing radical SAM protein [Candidatus Omnitrophota bacterium]
MNPSIALCLVPAFWPKMPPLSLVCLGGFLLAKSYSVSIFDLNNRFYNLATDDLKTKWLKSIDSELEENIFSWLNQLYPAQTNQTVEELSQFDIVGFSCYQSNFKSTLSFAALLKQNKPKIKILLGGPQITRLYFNDPENFSISAFANIDLLVVGEGEQALDDYLQGKINKNKIALFSELKDLNVYNPLLGYSQIDLDSYPRKHSVSLLFSRGCRRKCAFCSERLLYKHVRTRSIDNIIKEIAYHQKNKAQSFIFHDSMLNMDLVNLENLCDAIIKNFGSINWEAQMGIRPDMSDQLFAKLKQSGCYNLFVGLESGSANTLKNMRKGFTKQIAARFFEQLKKADVYFGVSIIVGYPDETEDDLAESLEFLIKHKDLIPKIEQVNPFVYYSGTEADKQQDFYNNKAIADKVEYFISQLKKHKFKMTNAFLNNLIEK